MRVKDLIRKVLSEEGPDVKTPAGLLSTSDPVKRADLATRLFVGFNTHRLAKLREQAGDRAITALKVLPYLLHVNQEGLPGYTGDSECPFGVACYEPTGDDRKIIQTLFPAVKPNKRAIRRMAVDIVAVMGSAGSIGFAEGSDLDIWIGFRLSDHSRGAMLVFEEKVRDIEQWMNRHSGVEIHLFVQAVENIRTNDFGIADLEGCGSALGALLKEEFYRTAIYIAGRKPYWWLTPPDCDEDTYQATIQELNSSPGFTPSEYLDLGTVNRVQPGELFGAAIWQISKGQKSPFKSALKMGHVEKVMFSGTAHSNICEKLKQCILNGEKPDPYRLLFDDVLGYYSGRSDLSAEELLAECFYLKTGINLTQADLAESDGEGPKEVLARYVKTWGWGRRKLDRLNNFASWKFEWVKDMSGELDKFFMRSYKRINDKLAESGGGRAITDRDLTVIGRKLQVAYRQAPNKMGRIHLLTRSSLEHSLSLIESQLITGESEWRLYRGRVTTLNEEEKQPDLIRSFVDPLELLVWSAYNHILGKDTRLFVSPLERQYSSADLETLAPVLIDFFDEAKRRDENSADLLQNPKPVSLLVLPNLASDDDNIVEAGAIYVTTWGETFFVRFGGPTAFKDFVEGVLIDFWTNAPDPSKVSVYAPKRKLKALTGPASRLARWMPRLSKAFGHGREADVKERVRFVFKEANGFSIIEKNAGEFKYLAFPSLGDTMRHLCGLGPYDLVMTLVEGESADLALLSVILESHEQGKVDVFLVNYRNSQEIFVVDEIGNISRQATSEESLIYDVTKLLFFLENTFEEIVKHRKNPLSQSKSLAENLRIFKVAQQPLWRASQVTREIKNEIAALNLKPMGLSIERTVNALGAPVGYVIKWGKETIRSGEVSHPLEELKKRINQLRHSEKRYNVYVTKLFLDENFLRTSSGGFPANGHFLFYKGAIERRLNS